MENYYPSVEYTEEYLSKDQIISIPCINPCINGSFDLVLEVDFSRGQVQYPGVMRTTTLKDLCGFDLRGSS
jgi:hypothetical protein